MDTTLLETDLRAQRLTIMERISLFTVYRDNGCWEYTKGRQEGYAQIKYQGKAQLITHIVWRIMKGRKVHKGFQLNHTCDNPRCYNPDHIYEGTQAQNLKDWQDRGKQSYFTKPKLEFIKIEYEQHMKRRFL